MRFRSKKEKEFYDILAELFPNSHIQHDYRIERGLMIDFYIESPCKIAFEVDGAQHFELNSMFHRLQDDFLQQRQRDARKEHYCYENGIALIRVDARKNLDKDKVRAKVHEALDDLPEKTVGPSWKERSQDRQRAYRAEQYRKMKANRKG